MYVLRQNVNDTMQQHLFCFLHVFPVLTALSHSSVAAANVRSIFI